MAKPGRKAGAKSRIAEESRRRIVDAAIDVLRTEGFTGASAAAIARQGGFSQGLIFYHFGTVPDLLLAALDETSARRMEAYRTALDRVQNLNGLIEVATRIFREDLRSGHIKVLAELIAGSSSTPSLGPKIVDRIAPWTRLTEEALGRALAATPLEAVVPVRELAHGIVALYLGVELLTHLEGGENGETARALFDAGARLTTFFGPLMAGIA